MKNLQKYQIAKQSSEVETMVAHAVSLVAEKYEIRKLRKNNKEKKILWELPLLQSRQ